jgi:chromosome segregation ATPase
MSLLGRHANCASNWLSKASVSAPSNSGSPRRGAPHELQEHWQRLFPDEPLPSTVRAGAEEEGQIPARSAIEKLRRTLQAMGEVNLGAADEYARLSERIDTLTQQRDDLLQTASELERTLRDIDRHARQRFEETYEAARVAFRERFQQLFEGGHADLILTDYARPAERRRAD